MGRSNYAILAMGLVSMLVLSTLMKYFLKATDETREEPMVQELMVAFGDRLDERCELEFREDPEHEGGKRAVLRISPSMLGISMQALVRDMGELVWRNCSEDVPLTSVVVEVIPWQKNREPRRIAVARPYMSGRRSPIRRAAKPPVTKSPDAKPPTETAVPKQEPKQLQPATEVPATIPPAAEP